MGWYVPWFQSVWLALSLIHILVYTEDLGNLLMFLFFSSAILFTGRTLTLNASSIKTGRPYWDAFSPYSSTDDWHELAFNPEIEA